MAEEHEIQIGTPKVLGVDPKEPGLLQVRVPLSSSPDADWAAIFQTTIPPGAEMPVSMHMPELVHRSRFIELRVEDTKLLEHLAVVREMVAATNALYASEIITKRDRLAEEQRLAEEEIGADAVPRFVACGRAHLSFASSTYTGAAHEARGPQATFLEH